MSQNRLDIGIKKYINMYNGLLGLASNKLKLKRLYHFPVDIQIEPTSRCNISCIMCGRTYIHRKNGDMSLAGFKNIILNMKYLQSLTLNGLGEPLLNPDIFDMISFAKSKGIKVRLSSNATLLDHLKSEQLVLAGLDNLFISLDGACSKTYDCIRKGADFENVVKNIETLVKAKDGKELPHITIDVVGMRSNLEEIPQIIELAASIDVKDVNVRHVYFDYETRDYTEVVTGKEDSLKSLRQESLFSEDKNRVREIFQAAADTSIRLGVRLHLPAIKLDDTATYGLKTFHCVWPWLNTYIDFEGFVTPCCICPDKNEICFGNINDTPFKDIWNNAEYRKFRNNLAGNNSPKVCETCMRPINAVSSYTVDK